MNYEAAVGSDKITSTMTSWQLAAPGKFKAVQVALPEPGPHEVRVRMEGCGLCASSIPVWEGRSWFTYPQENGNPGHEGYGIVDKVGTGVVDFAVGDRVTGLTFHSFADYDLAKASELVKIPEDLKYMPLPGEPLGCAVNIFRRSLIDSNSRVAIIGTGFLGSLLTQMAHRKGAEVFAISRRPYSLEFASQMGADHLLPFDDADYVEKKIGELTDGKGCDCVIEATGAQASLDLATRLVSFGGRIVVAGFHQGGLRQVNMQEWNWKGIDVINAHERDPARYVAGIREALESIRTCQLDVTPLFTHYFTPDRLNEAFEMLVERPDGFMKAIVLFH